MDSSRFDFLTRQFAARQSRRSFLKSLAIGTVTYSGLRHIDAGAALATDDCAQFCQALPPGSRGQCVSEAAHGAGLCYECGPGAPEGSSLELCGSVCIDTVDDGENCGGCGITCGSNAACMDGSCQCWAGYDFCEASGQCASTYCGLRQSYDPATCTCICDAPYIPLPNTGVCARPCESDADCFDVPGSCKTTPEGQKLCGACGYNEACTGCTSSASCQACGYDAGAFCSADDGVCYTACP